ncbi:hypothetical protein A4A49_23167 [Nicotiana attenuata]|uniref:SURP motif domain-containing protein n=1 Tax=Nicotiana attenuata TaxID=49451 RepID=A0A1J6L1V4_NICAT|nr:hypothetical protein A4A49_23167 [Nicotiana attenuata]
MSMDGNVGQTPPDNEAYNVPPDTKFIIDKVAPFVAKNGERVESGLKRNHAGDARFSFLNASDPYHAYYQYCVAEAYVPDRKPTQPAVSASAPITY